MRTYIWLILLSTLLILGGAVLYTRAAAIQPFERLPGGLAAGPSVEEITSTSAVVTVKTVAPAFCQVNYGPTPQYGQLRRMSMSGPMTDHRILLSGMQPDTQYHVRLTAVDVQARVYQSGDLAFRTRSGTSDRPPGRNVASLQQGARVLGVSSNYGGEGIAGAYGANKALDGDPSTEWSSNGDGDKAWIEVALARPYHLSAIGFWTRSMGLTAQVQEFDVIADGKKRLGPFIIQAAVRTHYFPLDVTAQRLRFNVLKSSGGNTGAFEIEALTVP